MNLTTISFTPVATYFFLASSNLTLSKIFRLLYRTIVLPTTQQYPCWLQHYERQICQNTTKSPWKIFSTRLLIPKEIWLLFWWSSPRYLVSVPLIIYLILFNIWMNTERSCSGFHDQRWSHSGCCSCYDVTSVSCLPWISASVEPVFKKSSACLESVFEFVQPIERNNF